MNKYYLKYRLRSFVTNKRFTKVVMIIAVTIGFIFLMQKYIYRGRAAASSNPEEIKITNISDNSFTVSWITPDKATIGFINYGESENLNNPVFDDRDTSAPLQYYVHHVTIKNLKPLTNYYFKINSDSKTYDDNGLPYKQITAPTTSETPPLAEPIFGTIQKKDGKPAEEAIAYITSPKSSSLSALVKNDGNWLITLNNARTSDMSGYVSFSENDQLELLVQAVQDGKTKTTIKPNSKEAQQTVTIEGGKRYDSRADLNNDGVINTIDLQLLRARLGKRGSDLPGDINKDGMINSIDFMLILKTLIIH